MATLVYAEARDEYKLLLKYSDGLEGEVDLIRTISKPDYENLRDKEKFRNVKIDSLTNDIVWDDCPALCKNALYKQLELRVLMKNLKIDVDKI